MGLDIESVRHSYLSNIVVSHTLTDTYIMITRVILLLFVSSLSARPQTRKRVRLPSSYLAPQDQATAASKTFVTKASAPVSLYSGPIIDEDVSASSDSFLASYGDQISAPASVEPVSLYSSPIDLARGNDYSQPQADVITSSTTNFVTKKAPTVTSTRVVSDYTQPQASVITVSESSDDERVAAGSSVSSSVVNSLGVKTAKSKPIAILRSENTGVNNGQYSYSYEAENGISQSVSGEMKTVNDAQVYVMRGSYSYIGTDGLTYQADWYADETGYHPSAPHLPRSVVPNHPEVAEAVRAQLEYAAQEEAAAASSDNSVVVAAPDNVSFDSFSAPEQDLAGYGY